jgi:hypothetical protein
MNGSKEALAEMLAVPVQLANLFSNQFIASLNRLSCAANAATSAFIDLADICANSSPDPHSQAARSNIVVADNTNGQPEGDKGKIANEEYLDDQRTPRNVLPLTAAIWQHGSRIVHEGIPQWCCATCLYSFSSGFCSAVLWLMNLRLEIDPFFQSTRRMGIQRLRARQTAFAVGSQHWSHCRRGTHHLGTDPGVKAPEMGRSLLESNGVIDKKRAIRARRARTSVRLE